MRQTLTSQSFPFCLLPSAFCPLPFAIHQGFDLCPGQLSPQCRDNLWVREGFGKIEVTAKENGQLMLPVWTPYGSSDRLSLTSAGVSL